MNDMILYFDRLHQLMQSVVVLGEKKMSLAVGLLQFVDFVVGVHKNRKKVIFVGNGGSAGIASHQSVDYWKNGKIKAIAFNDSSLLTCIANDYGYPYVFEKPLQMFAEEGDLLIAISSSGNSENILNGVKAARNKNCSVVTMSGFRSDNKLSALGDLNFYVPSKDGEYGQVEIIHLALCHNVLDYIIGKDLLNSSHKD